VILTHKALSTLGEALDKAILSVLHQDRTNTEVALVDNGIQQVSRTSTLRGNVAAVKIAGLSKNYSYCLGNDKAPRYVNKENKYILFTIFKGFLGGYISGPVLVLQSSETEDFGVYRYLLRGFVVVGKSHLNMIYSKPLWKLAVALPRIISSFFRCEGYIIAV